MAEIEITQVRSLIGSSARQRRTLSSLGLRRIRHTVTKPDRPEIRGMIATVAHLVDVRYSGAAEPLDLEPGQRPKGEGNPPAGASVSDEEAAQVAEELDEALAEPGSVTDAGDLVQNPPSLQTTDTVNKPKPRGGAVDEPEAELTSTEDILDAAATPDEADEQ